MSYSFQELAVEVLSKSPQPLTYQEIWKLAEETGVADKIQSVGKTPWASLGAQLYVEVRDNPDSRFVKVGKRPARFFLKSRLGEVKSLPAKEGDGPELATSKSSSSYKEKELHALLTYYVSAFPTFNRGREIITKTIHHEKSKKSSFKEWTHPDIVGFSLPLDDWHLDVIELNELSDRNALTLFSFELKRQLTKSTYREAYFQAVSNSSWAHEGYLVAAEVAEDEDLYAELDRLASSFGIGIIHLNLEDLGSTKVLYPARKRETLDWETINKLSEQNSDFLQFIQNVKIDINAKRVHRSEYDEIIKDLPAYLAQLHKSTDEVARPKLMN